MDGSELKQILEQAGYTPAPYGGEEAQCVSVTMYTQHAVFELGQSLRGHRAPLFTFPSPTTIVAYWPGKEWPVEHPMPEHLS